METTDSILTLDCPVPEATWVRKEGQRSRHNHLCKQGPSQNENDKHPILTWIVSPIDKGASNRHSPELPMMPTGAGPEPVQGTLSWSNMAQRHQRKHLTWKDCPTSHTFRDWVREETSQIFTVNQCRSREYRYRFSDNWEGPGGSISSLRS